jgi:uncharacterized protein YndB with AHSA1/START domain
MKVIDITVARIIPAPADRAWLGAERVILNPVVDGLFYFAVQHERRRWAHYGRFLAVERPHRVEYTWMSEATQGCESVVAVTFEPRGGQTAVTLRHSGLPDDALGRQHEEGWTWALSMLAERLAATPV